MMPLTLMQKPEGREKMPVPEAEEKRLLVQYHDLNMSGAVVCPWPEESNSEKLGTLQLQGFPQVIYHFTTTTLAFFGKISSMTLSKRGYCSNMLLRIPRWTLDLT